MSKVSLGIGTFVIGVLCGFGGDWLMAESPELALQRAIAFNTDPGNYTNEGNGLLSMTPMDMRVPLAQMVRDGMIRHTIVLFPGVPETRETTMMWMRAVNDNDDLITASGIPQTVGIDPRGDRIQAFEIWYRPGSEKDVQGIINEIEQYHQQANSGGRAEPAADR